MLVCHCHRISDKTIRLCVRQGARCADDVADACGAGTTCGGCRMSVEAIVSQEAEIEEERRSGRPAPLVANG